MFFLALHLVIFLFLLVMLFRWWDKTACIVGMAWSLIGIRCALYAMLGFTAQQNLLWLLTMEAR
jgi:hypothetical protein